MPNCPICATPSVGRYRETPYETCGACGCWFQYPLPPKRYTGPHEVDVDQMSDRDKEINASLADWLFESVMRGKPGEVLDVGSRYPWLAHWLASTHGCEAWGLEHETVTHDLKVRTIAGDFETFTDRLAWQADLITLIHVFEHFADPLAALRKLRKLVANDGRVFIRLPDHDVPGFERDLTDGHYTIHPFYHCLTDLCEMLAQLGDAFVIESTTQENGIGQRDLVLRPVTRAPTIGLGMIVKNEERDLPRLLKSVAMCVDGGVLIDTGSTDRTPEIISDAGYVRRTYLGASIKDDFGDWKLQNFGKARNQYSDSIADAGFDWLFWCDADDEVLTPRAIRRASYLPPASLGMWIELEGGVRQLHHRMFPASERVRFEGWCHEVPILPPHLPTPILNDCAIRHDAAPHGDETSNARNLRILTAQWAVEPSPRCAFYIAQTHKDAGRMKEAAKWYQERNAFGPGFNEEYIFSHLYLSRAFRNLKDYERAIPVCRAGLAAAPDWQELRMELAFIAYDQKKYRRAIYHATMALDQPMPPTVLWRESTMYSDQPARLISWCHEHRGNIPAALAWSQLATERINGVDVDWQARQHRLSRNIGTIADGRTDHTVTTDHAGASAAKAPALVTRRKERIALVRPGAIGDVLMTLNLLPAFKEANPDAEIRYYTAVKGLQETIRQAGVQPYMLPDAPDEYCDRVINLVGYPLAEGYPDKPMRAHLLTYFGAEMGLTSPVMQTISNPLGGEPGIVTWDNRSLPALELPMPARPAFAPVGDYATIQRASGWSKYKCWDAHKWNAVRAGLPFVFAEIDETYGYSLSEEIALFANARIHLGVDSFANHLTNYFWKYGNRSRRVPGVILWGSTQMEAAGYPTNINIGHRLPCGPCFRENPEISAMPRGPCVTPPRPTYEDDTPHECMRVITIDEVVEAALKLWKDAK